MLSAIDVLAICPLELEFEAIRNALAIHGFKIQIEEPIHHQCRSMMFGRYTSTKLSSATMTICVLQTQHQGILRTACTTTDLIEKLRPKLVVSFGIAGLFESSDYRLGDVCVPESIFYYEPAKDAGTVLKKYRKGQAGQRLPAAEGAARRLHAPIIYTTNQTDYQHPNDIGHFRVALDRPIASGEKLIAAVGSLAKAEALQMHRQMIGVEMEAAGVAEACRSAPPHRRPKFIVVKGFSDLATTKSKNPTTKKGREEQELTRKNAASNAATQLAKFLLLNNETIEDALPAGRYLDSSRLSAQTKKLKEIVLPSSTLEYFPDDLRLQRPLLVGTAPIIYHFTVGSDGLVSWVDLYFLLVQKKIRDELGLCPHIFVSEPSGDSPSVETKIGVNKLLASLFGGRTYALYWSSDIQRAANQHRHYAERSRAVHPGFFDVLRDENTSTHGAGWTEHKTDRWLVFIIWLSRVLPVQCILAFDRRYALYEKLKQVPGLDPIVIYGKILRLADSDELSSRFSARIRTLGVTSSSLAPMLDWFAGELDRNVDDALAIAKSFVGYFGAFADETRSSSERQKTIVNILIGQPDPAPLVLNDTIAELARILTFIESKLYPSDVT